MSTARYVLALSAGTADALTASAQKLAAHFSGRGAFGQTTTLSGVAATLLNFRPCAPHRLALTAVSVAEAAEKLAIFTEHESQPRLLAPQGLYATVVEWSAFDGDLPDGQDQRYLRELAESGRHEQLAKLWSVGFPVDWRHVYPDLAAERPVYLPPTPLHRRRYWPQPGAAGLAGAAGVTGAAGAVGVAGAAGAGGAAGAAETAGAGGAVGAAGAACAAGAVGVAGAAETVEAGGAAGVAGVAGMAGACGAAGAGGVAGGAGAAGAVGVAGPVETAGAGGAVGAGGAAGVAGAAGAAGAVGAASAVGVAGAAGAAETPGVAGAPGATERAGAARPVRTAPVEQQEDLRPDLVEELAGLPTALRTRRLCGYLQDHIAAVLDYPAGERPRTDSGFFDLGMSSVHLVQVRQSITADTAFEPSETSAFDHPTIADFAAYLAGELVPERPAEPALDEAAIERLSAHDLERVLTEVLA